MTTKQKGEQSHTPLPSSYVRMLEDLKNRIRQA